MFKDFFEDCSIGDRTITQGRTITESDVVSFAALSSDWNAIHTDRHYAAKHSPYGQRVAHGLLGLVAGLCLLSRQGWFTFWPKSWLFLSGLDRVRFVAPIFIGDTIYLNAEIVHLQPMDADKGIVTTRMRIRNQDDTLVISARVQLIVGRRTTSVESTSSTSNELSDA